MMGLLMNGVLGAGMVVMVFIGYDEYTKASTAFEHFLWAFVMGCNVLGAVGYIRSWVK